jgi:hypothetical protein
MVDEEIEKKFDDWHDAYFGDGILELLPWGYTKHQLMIAFIEGWKRRML